MHRYSWIVWLTLSNKEPELLISIFLSFLFGSEESLGYDPTIRRYPGDHIYYEYKVEDRYFRTSKSLSNYRSLGITGRMTRVWKAREISDFGGPYVQKKSVALKDVWLDQGAQTELQIQGKIFKAIERERDLYDAGEPSRLQAFSDFALLFDGVKKNLENGSFRKYFMTIDCDYVGQATKPMPARAVPTAGLFTRVEETTRTFTISGADRSRARDIIIRPSPNTTAMQTDASLCSAPHNSMPTPSSAPLSTMGPTTDNNTLPTRLFQPKKRYYLVFSEVGQALYDVPTLPIFFKALSDVLLGERIVPYCRGSCSPPFTSTGFPVYRKLGSSRH